MNEQPVERDRIRMRRLAAACILAVFVLLPALMAHLLTLAPRTRSIHIEAFRYGFSPSRLHVNRGDRLKLTFSTRDTGQSFFLQDYDLHIIITPGTDVVEVRKLSQPDQPPAQERVVELTAGLPGWRGRFVSKSQFRNHTYNGPLHGTERGDLIVSPNYLLWGGLGLLCGLFLAGWLLAGSGAGIEPRRPSINLFRIFPRLKGSMKRASFQFALALPMLGVFYLLVLAGFIGTKVSGRNAGPMVIWVLWLSALILLLVPLGGRIWCLVCPLPMFGEWLHRFRLARFAQSSEDQGARRVLGIPLNWPDWMRSAWPRVIFFLLLGTFSTALVAIPSATSWLLLVLVVLAMAMAAFPQQRLFCRHICPINSFISLYAMTGRLQMRSVSAETCLRCEERFCLTGSARGWGCPYGLCMGEVHRNNDCGLCTECVKTCAYDNVALFWRRSGWDREVIGHDEAWQAIVLFGLSIIYSVINLGAWHTIRDWVDIVDKRNWVTFWLYSGAIWALCLGILPLLLYLLTQLGRVLSGARLRSGVLFRACSAALVPLGLSCWMAFALAMLSSMWTFLLQSLSDPFNWGWDLLSRAGSSWNILWSPAIPWLQVACVATGVIYSLRTLYLCWQEQTTSKRQAILGFLPWGSFLWAAAAGMIAFFAG